MNDEFVIQVNIAGKYYKLHCKRSEEYLYRKAAKQINDKILQYEATFPDAGLELKDLLAMVAFQLSLGDVKMEDKEDVSPVFKKLDELNLDVEKFIISNS